MWLARRQPRPRADVPSWAVPSAMWAPSLNHSRVRTRSAATYLAPPLPKPQEHGSRPLFGWGKPLLITYSSKALTSPTRVAAQALPRGRDLSSPSPATPRDRSVFPSDPAHRIPGHPICCSRNSLTPHIPLIEFLNTPGQEAEETPDREGFPCWLHHFPGTPPAPALLLQGRQRAPAPGRCVIVGLHGRAGAKENTSL